MRLTRIGLRKIRMPLVHPFETSFGRTTERQILLVEVEDADGAIGWGEVTCGERPFYNEEWVDAAWLVLRDFVAPSVLGTEFGSAADVGGGHPPLPRGGGGGGRAAGGGGAGGGGAGGAHQAQDQARLGRRRDPGGATALSRDPADGGCQLRLHAGRC